MSAGSVAGARMLLVCSLLTAAWLAPAPNAAASEQLTAKESFMLMFGKGNGAMRLLCALQKDGLIDQATRIRWTRQLDVLLSERGDSEEDRRNTRIGMAFADSRPGLCPTKVMGHTTP